MGGSRAAGGGENAAAPFRKRKMCGLTAEEEGGKREGMSNERGMKMKRLSYQINITKFGNIYSRNPI